MNLTNRCKYCISLKNRDSLRLLLSSALGLGLSPFAPGTCGALMGVIIHVIIVIICPPGLRILSLVIALVLIIIICYLLTPWAVEYWKESDPPHFVLDEVAGYLLVPILFWKGSLWQAAITGFCFFRLFDVIKIPPASQIDKKMNNAWGIILDDLVSGAYAAIILHLLFWIGTRESL